MSTEFQLFENGKKQGNVLVLKDLFFSSREEILEYSSIGNIGILTVDLSQKAY